MRGACFKIQSHATSIFLARRYYVSGLEEVGNSSLQNAQSYPIHPDDNQTARGGIKRKARTKFKVPRRIDKPSEWSNIPAPGRDSSANSILPSSNSHAPLQHNQRMLAGSQSRHDYSTQSNGRVNSSEPDGGKLRTNTRSLKHCQRSEYAPSRLESCSTLSSRHWLVGDFSNNHPRQGWTGPECVDAWLMHRRNVKETQSPMIFNQGTNSCSNDPPGFYFHLCSCSLRCSGSLFKWTHLIDTAAVRAWART